MQALDSGAAVLYPTTLEIAGTCGFILSIALFLWAAISLSKSIRRLTRLEAILWLTIVLIIPIVGPLLWLSSNGRMLRRNKSL
ncbi:PLDc N-terminal domain-containing protein [Specibacter cremeus]|uniref:PLDc N-terminal domain-containing protein n=1 Tax=Specibacter cremeus TaxID=1629051 RepID=UPI0013DE4FC5|nr:PLDc N-terminal domain-containing protein [Specibacter cremeus]